MIFPSNPIQWWFYKWLNFSHSHHTSHDTDYPLLSSICHDMRYEIPFKKDTFSTCPPDTFSTCPPPRNHRGGKRHVIGPTSGRGDPVQCPPEGKGPRRAIQLGDIFLGIRDKMTGITGRIWRSGFMLVNIPRNPTWNCMLFLRSPNMNLWYGLKWIMFPRKSCN